MKLRLKNGKEFNVVNVTETKSASLWFLSFVITDSVSSDDIDGSFTGDAISEIVLTADNEEETTLTGYSKIIRATISHSVKPVTTAIQLSKAA